MPAEKIGAPSRRFDQGGTDAQRLLRSVARAAHSDHRGFAAYNIYALASSFRAPKSQPMKSLLLVLLGLVEPVAAMAQNPPDPNLWLEDVSGDAALKWVRGQDETTKKELTASADFEPIRARLLSIYNSKDRIPYVTKAGAYYYNFWRDTQHVRGIWRRTSLEEYRKQDPAWETVLDLDKLASDEKENWVWSYEETRYPDYTRALIHLSRGGGDASTTREFDLVAKAFVKDGFTLPEAKTDISWRGADSVYVSTDFGPGSMTDSGYPLVVKTWQRGTPVEKATKIFEGQKTDVGAAGFVSDEAGFHREFVTREMTTFTSENYVVLNGNLVRLDIPADASFGTFREFFTVTLRKGWTVAGRTYPPGAMLAIPWDAFLAGGRDFKVLFTPSARVSLAGATYLRNRIIVNELDNVRNRLYVLTPEKDGTWSRVAMPAPEFGTVSADAVERESDTYFLSIADFLTPSGFYIGDADNRDRNLLKQLPEFFSSEGLEVSQHEASSKDGTRVPYFQVSRKGFALDGSHPTLLTGYGGFQVSETPYYSGGIGAAWLEQGGVYVVANIRGGGEFGPDWHEAAIKEHRQRAYDDFISVAEDLVARQVTSPKHLGIMGGSNGGLLVGVMLTERPDLFGAVVCQSPLLDMRRFSHLLAGASWMGEYGDPDVPEEWSYISRYSPYQNVKEGVAYPRVLFTTSTRDDRVHPGHARKMASKMEAQHHDVLFYENTEGGHGDGGAANNEQRAFEGALTFSFLLKQLR
jgi:prolyl oligopeptidase